MPPDFSASDHLLLSPPLHAIPIRDRPSICVTRRILRPTLFYTFFLSSCLLIHLFQLLLLPLYLLPFSRRAYHRGIAWTKDGFGSLLIAVVQLFGPSSFVVTVEESLVMEEMVRRDGGGRVVGLRMAERSLFVANHQQYADWVYIWILFTLSSIGTGICIILKASLRWPPVLGPAMQLFRFAFVSKEKPLQKSGIYETAKDNLESGLPFSLLLFPEGTLLSPLTRPKSAAFAKASGVPDLKNLLTPRSTGLLHCLRTLSSLSPDLLLYDATIGYPGVPSGGHAQQFYTLHSTFGLGIPPPSVHIHLRVIPLAAIPLGARTVKATPEQLEEELSVDERLEFQEWTRRRWEEKDELLARLDCSLLSSFQARLTLPLELAMASKASNDRPLHTIPIPERAPINPLRTYALTLFFALVFLGMHLSQVVLYPLSWLPGGLRALYWDYVRFSKESFARVLVWISSETTLVITCDSSIRLQDVLEKDESGKVIGLKLKQRAVIVSNHQQYGDWIYLWSFFYASSLAGAVVIILKASLQYIPIGGPAMKLWDFVFLASSWETDRGPTGKNLRTLGTRASKYKKSLALLVFPEGTLVSKLTRPGSARFAERIGEPDMRNMILPRSTGLLFCLRTLLSVTPDLALYDITIGYPGVPPAGYAQSYYTLSSIYSGDGAPPTVHMHLRSFGLAQVPIGIVDAALSPDEADEAVTADERKAFDVWTRERWTEKDELLDEFYKAGEFPAEEGQRVEIPIGLRGFDDYLAVASNFVAVYAAWRLMKWAMALYSSS